jgi:Uma2 family endonuclease
MSPQVELVREFETATVALDPEREYEIVNGQPEVKEMAGAGHGGITARLIAQLVIHTDTHNLGGVYTPDTTFKIGSNDRLPDIAFVAAERIPAEGEPEGLWQIAPDLAVEVISPNDLWEKVQSKVREYFAAGVQEVWLVAPESKEVQVYTAPQRVEILTEAQELTSQLLPGFRCKLSEIFKAPARRSA